MPILLQVSDYISVYGGGSQCLKRVFAINNDALRGLSGKCQSFFKAKVLKTDIPPPLERVLALKFNARSGYWFLVSIRTSYPFAKRLLRELVIVCNTATI